MVIKKHRIHDKVVEDIVRFPEHYYKPRQAHSLEKVITDNELQKTYHKIKLPDLILIYEINIKEYMAVPVEVKSNGRPKGKGIEQLKSGVNIIRDNLNLRCDTALYMAYIPEPRRNTMFVKTTTYTVNKWRNLDILMDTYFKQIKI